MAEYIGQMTDNATSLPRLSIPNYSWLNDDQHGVKQPDATAFPNGGSMGASFSTELLNRVGLAIGTEARGVHNSLEDKSGETGGHTWPGTIRNGVGLTMYAPNVNLVHDPRWGRANEVMSRVPAPQRRPGGRVRAGPAKRHARGARGHRGPPLSRRLLQALRGL